MRSSQRNVSRSNEHVDPRCSWPSSSLRGTAMTLSLRRWSSKWPCHAHGKWSSARRAGGTGSVCVDLEVPCFVAGRRHGRLEPRGTEVGANRLRELRLLLGRQPFPDRDQPVAVEVLASPRRVSLLFADLGQQTLARPNRAVRVAVAACAHRVCYLAQRRRRNAVKADTAVLRREPPGDGAQLEYQLVAPFRAQTSPFEAHDERAAHLFERKHGCTHPPTNTAAREQQTSCKGAPRLWRRDGCLVNAVRRMHTKWSDGGLAHTERQDRTRVAHGEQSTEPTREHQGHQASSRCPERVVGVEEEEEAYM